jgi:hypothetical protein
MAFIPIPDTVLVRLYVKTGIAELKASISLYFSKPNFVETDMEDLLSDLETNFVPEVADKLCDDYNFYLLEAYDMNTEDGLKITRSIDIDGNSGLSDTPLSPAMCCVVTFRGNKRGPWNSGRNFVAGLTEQSCDQTNIGQDVIDSLVTAYQALIDQPPSGWTWVIASRYFKKAPRSTGVVTPVKTVLVRSDRFGVQKRRAQRP